MTDPEPAEKELPPGALVPTPKIEIATSPGFGDWLGSIGGSLVFTAYHSAKVVFVGRGLEDGALALSEGTFPRCMGIGAHPSMRALVLATKHQLVRFENLLPPGVVYEGHDAIFSPHRTWVTGYLDIHDVAMMADKSLVFVNTMFSALSTVSDGYSFKPIWQPAFITDLVPEDRCHMNGMAIEGNQPRFVTALGGTNVEKGWRENLAAGGVLIDVATRQNVLEGLSMPHSPRIHDGRLWMLQSGQGAFGYVDLQARKFVEVAFCPGYARGMALTGNHAIVCLSMPRSDEKDFSHLPLGERLRERGEDARSGLVVIDIRNGETVAWLTALSGARELFDVAVLPGVRCPKVIDFFGEEIDRVMLMDPRR